MLKGGSMSKVNDDYDEKDVIDFLKEEFERIITKYPRQSRGSTLNDAQALAIWFLHQEVGIDDIKFSPHGRYRGGIHLKLDCNFFDASSSFV